MPANVKNPSTGKTSGVFKIDSYVNTYYIDSLSTLTVTPDTFNDIINPTATRNVVSVNTAFKLSLTF